ncbi:MAG: helix-turn-helix domain-containing protein, partial [Rikenellaceae bacterium]
AHMLFVRLPIQLQGSFFQRSLRLMGVAFLFVPLSCFLYTQTNRLDLDPIYAAAISLSAYFPTFVLMSIAFLILLGKRYGRVVIWATVITILLFPMPLWLSLMRGDDELISTVMASSYSYFVIVVAMLDTFILINYHRVKRNIENYYSDDTIICVNWISKSIKLLIGLSVTCALAPIFSIYPHWLRLLFMLYGVFCYLHIHYGYRRMTITMLDQFVYKNQNIADLVEVERDNLSDATLAPDVFESIERGVKMWVEEQRYMQSSVTINMMASEINTNRTYLSRYINTTCSCSFKNWITQLRLLEAKRMLSSNLDVSISVIAAEVGFASVESFTHVFKRIEGVSPARWREQHVGEYTAEI